MKNELKGFIIGCFSSLILFSSLPSFAQEFLTVLKANSTIYLNNKKIQTELPVLNYQGYTYLPLRKISESIGLDISYVAKSDSIYISEPMPMPKPTPTPNPFASLTPLPSLPPYWYTTEPSLIESKIEDDFEGFGEGNIYKLDNGQIWRQVSYEYDYHYSYRPEVTIIKSGSKYMMFVEDMDDKITVEKLK